MSAVKIHCALGLNLFAIPQFTIVNTPAAYLSFGALLRNWQLGA
jgi:hypothetical protein